MCHCMGHFSRGLDFKTQDFVDGLDMGLSCTLYGDGSQMGNEHLILPRVKGW